jgi:hypothetical protein
MAWDWKVKSAIAAGIIILLAATIFIVKQQRDIIANQQKAEQSTAQMKQLRDDIVRAQASYATTKDVERIIKDSGVDLGPIKADLKKLGADIQGVSTVVAANSGYHVVNIPSTTTTAGPKPPPETTVTCPDGKTVKCPNTDPYGYRANQQWLALDEPFGTTKVPWGKVGFSSWSDKPWELKTAQRKYKVVNVVSTNAEGRHFFHSKFTIESDGKTYPITIADSQYVEVMPKSEFRFSPRLYLGLDAGVLAHPFGFELTPNLQLALFSYGKTKITPEWTFLGLGAGYEVKSNTMAFLISPIDYNIGENLPFIENTYIGPSLGWDLKGNFSFLFGVRVGL